MGAPRWSRCSANIPTRDGVRLRNLNPFVRIRDLEERVAALEGTENYAWYAMPPRHEALQVDGIGALWVEASSEYAGYQGYDDEDVRSNLYL